MLLWLMNFDFAGSEVAFFVSGAIPITAVAADIPAPYEGQIIAKYEAQITAKAEGEVST